MSGSAANVGSIPASLLASAQKAIKKPSSSLLRRLGEESREQIALIEWAGVTRVPGSSDSISKHLIYINNGGKRSALAGYVAQLMGEKKGASDLFLALPSGGFHGLFIELKAKTGKPSREQVDFLHDRMDKGYLAVLCHGWDSARSVITDYLSVGGVQ